MMKTYTILAIALAVLLQACNENDTGAQNSQQNVTSVAVTTDFAAPADGLLSPEKIKTYTDASTALLMLSQQWIDRMNGTADPQEKILILGGFDKARDQVCRKIGLSGLKEFNWISDVAIKNPANRAVVEKAGIKLVNQ